MTASDALIPTPPPPRVAPPQGRLEAAAAKRNSPLRQIPFWVLLIAFAVIFLYPFVWLLSASFKPRADVFDNLLIPKTFTLANYVEVWQVAPLLRWLGNSGYVGLLAAGTVTISSALVAFGFAYFRFRAKNVLFGLVLATMMLPSMVTIIPVFLIWKDLGAVGTRLPLWGQNLFGSAFYIFLLRQFFLGLPRELFEAARVDGCSYFGLFWRIAVPLSKPALIIVVPLGLNTLFVKFNPIAGGEGDFQYIVTAALLATIPLVLIFLVGQRYFVEGIATQGRKG